MDAGEHMCIHDMSVDMCGCVMYTCASACVDVLLYMYMFFPDRQHGGQ